MNDVAIEVEDLTRKFGGFTAVDRVSFQVHRGEIFGYLGANGAGKSTTIRMLCGLLPPTSGRAVVAGHEVSQGARAVKQSIGYMSQRFSLYLDLTVEENLQFFAGAYEMRGQRRARRIERALELAGLTERREALTSALAGGIRQRLALASALLHEPSIIFLDEPTAGVDPTSRRAFWRLIRRLAHDGTTVFVTTHHLDEAEHCHRVGLMADGALVALDTPDGLKRTWVREKLWSVQGIGHGREVREHLREDADVVEVQPFGDRLHLFTVGRLQAREDVRALVQQTVSAASVEVESIEPTLEDVFLRMSRDDGPAGPGGQR